MKWLVMLLPLMLMLGACDGTAEREDLKSPCVGVKDSPCGPKYPVNDWWLA